MRTVTNGCSGWNRTNTVPLNRPVDYSYPTEQENWSARQDLHLRSLGPRPSMLLLHHALLPRPRAGAGGLVLVEMETAFPGNTYSIGDLADPKGLAAGSACTQCAKHSGRAQAP